MEFDLWYLFSFFLDLSLDERIIRVDRLFPFPKALKGGEIKCNSFLEFVQLFQGYRCVSGTP